MAFNGSLTQAMQDASALDVIMGVHGAGLTNMLWLRPGSAVIQLFPYGWYARCACWPLVPRLVTMQRPHASLRQRLFTGPPIHIVIVLHGVAWSRLHISGSLRHT